MPPQPSPCIPQLNPSWAQVFGTQVEPPQMFAMTAPQICVPEHVPQLSVPLHPLLAEPQLKPRLAHVDGVHGGCPHTLETPPPPHVSPGFAHVAPQLIV